MDTSCRFFVSVLSILEACISQERVSVLQLHYSNPMSQIKDYTVVRQNKSDTGM